MFKVIWSIFAVVGILAFFGSVFLLGLFYLANRPDVEAIDKKLRRPPYQSADDD